ncbi:MAG: hypothetical protein CME71_09040 [Halobacteriovorax sp.]|nr:hypothetical protein [Halobacteriovorax sp.]
MLKKIQKALRIKSLAHKIIVPNLVIVLLTSIAAFSFAKNKLEKTVRDEFKLKGESISKTLETGLQETLLNTSSSAVQGFIDEYRNIDGVSFIIIYDEFDQPLAHTFTPVIPKEYQVFQGGSSSEKVYSTDLSVNEVNVGESSHFVFDAPILAGLLGRAVIGMDVERKEAEVIGPLKNLFFIFTLGIFVAFSFLGSWILDRILQPINRLTTQAKRYSLGLEVETVHSTTQDEVGALIKAFNDLIERNNNYREDLEEEVRQRSDIIIQQKEQISNSARLSMLGEMSAGIAHEINNPLTVLSTGCMILKKQVSKEEINRERVMKIVDDNFKVIQRISKIISGMKNVSRDGSNDVFEAASLREIFEDSLSISSQRFRNQNVRLDCDLDHPSFDLSFKCRHVEVSQIIVNLLGNAFDAVCELDKPWVKVKADIDDEDLIIRISDSGPGIPKDVKDRIFIPFYTTKPVGKGTGIGLSLCLRIANNHGGSITLDESSEHTCFVVKLKLDPSKHV